MSPYPTQLSLHHIIPVTFWHMYHYQKPSSHYQFTYLLLFIHVFFIKINNISILTTANNTSYTNHKPSYWYAFDSNHIFPPFNRLTQVFPLFHILFEHIGTPSTQPMHTLHHIRTHLQTRTHMHTD